MDNQFSDGLRCTDTEPKSEAQHILFHSLQLRFQDAFPASLGRDLDHFQGEDFDERCLGLFSLEMHRFRKSFVG